MLKTQDASDLDTGFVSWQRCISFSCALTGMTLHVEMQLKCQLKTLVMSRLICLVKLEAEEKVFSSSSALRRSDVAKHGLTVGVSYCDGFLDRGHTDLPPACRPADSHCFFNGKQA